MASCFCTKIRPHLDPVIQRCHASCHVLQLDCFLVVNSSVFVSSAVRISVSKIVSLGEIVGSMKIQSIELDWLL